jgi:hypothetical protein
MMRRLILIAAVVPWLVTPRVEAAVIDDFAVGPVALQTTLGGTSTSTTQTGLDPAHVAGGKRSWLFDVRETNGTTPPPTSTVRMSVVAEPTPLYNYAADENVSAVIFQLMYNGGAILTADPGINVPLANAGHNAVVFEVIQSSFAQGAGSFDVFVDGRTTSMSSVARLRNSETPYQAFAPLFNTKGVAPATLRTLWWGTSNGNLFGSFQLARIRTASTADADFDGDVDGSDFLVWQRNFGTTIPTTSPHTDRIAVGDADLNGVVNNADLLMWRRAQNANATSANTAVPEPGALAMAAAALGGWALIRRRRSEGRFNSGDVVSAAASGRQPHRGDDRQRPGRRLGDRRARGRQRRAQFGVEHIERRRNLADRPLPLEEVAAQALGSVEPFTEIRGVDDPVAVEVAARLHAGDGPEMVSGPGRFRVVRVLRSAAQVKPPTAHQGV